MNLKNKTFLRQPGHIPVALLCLPGIKVQAATIIGSLFFLIVAAMPQAATIYVPKDYHTISDAVSSAHDGDEIVVSPGTYVGGMGFHGKNIVIRSTFNGDWSLVRFSLAEPARAPGTRILPPILELKKTLLAWPI